MDRDRLRAVQVPIKARYREEPAAAVVTLRAAGELDAQEVVCSVATGQAMVAAGHLASGSTRKDAPA